MKALVRKFKNSIMFLFKTLLVATTAGIYLLGYKRYYEVDELMFKDNYVIGVIYLLVLMALSLSYSSYRIGILRLRELIYSFTLAVILSNFTAWAQLSLMLHYFISLPPLLFVTAIQLTAATLLYIAANWAYFKLNPAQNAVAILSDPEDDERVLKKFATEGKRYKIVQYCHERDGYDAVKRAIDRQPLVLMLGHGSPTLRSVVIRHCYETNKRLLMVPTVDEIFINGAVKCQIDDIPSFLFRNRSMTNEQRMTKRLIDVVLSALALLALGPLMLAVAAAIRLYDGGPVFYRQIRVTENGRKFQLLKFRSMIPNAEMKGAEIASKDDPRGTPIGRVIRKCRVDELPQLINILRGEMSVVGPRPERPELTEKYCAIFPAFRYRLKVKAGLTGYAQVFGRYNTVFEDKVKLDLLYIENFSLMFDFYLMLSTIKVLFMPSSSEGI